MENRKVAVIHHILAHYREPIFSLMCKQSDIEYTFFSDPENNYSSVKVIDPEKANISIENGGLRWHFLKDIWLKYALWQKGAIKVCIDDKYDTIIFEGGAYFISTWIAAVIARIKGKRVLMWSHGFLRDEKGIKGWVRKIFYKLADGMLLYHNRAREIFIKKGFKPDNLYVVYNSLDYDSQIKIRQSISKDEISQCRKKLFKNPDLPVLVFIGRLIAQKKLEMILESVKLLKDQEFPCNILFIGDGPITGKLTDLAEELGLQDEVCFYGSCYDEKENAILISLSDLCVVPGGIGLTCMHSLVYGTPVITHNDFDDQGPEYEAIKDGYNGAFFKRDDVEDMARVIKKWFMDNKNSQDICTRCNEIIDKFYNAHYQIKVVNAAVMGQASTK